MTLFGLDLNSTRARAVSGRAGDSLCSWPLEGPHSDLPLALSLEGRYLEAGRAGTAICRKAPHLACLNFLPRLGGPQEMRQEWVAGRHRLDASAALSLVCQRLYAACSSATGLALAVPAYLTTAQAGLVAALAEKARLPVLGLVAAPLAAAMTAYAEQPWYGTAVVIDADDHALTLATIAAADGQAQVLDTLVLPQLSLLAWKGRLLDAVADRCVRQSRRDPRDSATAEQALYEQLEDALEACRPGRMLELVVQSEHWYQNLLLQFDDLVGFCAPLARQAAVSLQALLAAALHAPPRVGLLTAAAGRLPGLLPALQACFQEQEPVAGGESEDFGEDLLQEGGTGGAPMVTVLAPDAVATAAHHLATRWQHRDLPRGYLDTTVPLPPPQPVEAGPPRLHFRGQDYYLGGNAFTLGRQPTCDLTLDSEEYPGVSGWHCEIVFDRRHYFLRDRSRHGTLVNDHPVPQQVTLRPGDWIRLGPDGPLMRFLGQATDQHQLMPTA